MVPVPRQCPNCAGQAAAEAERLGTLEVTLQHVRGIGPECYDLFRCPGCELIYLSPLPPQEVLDTLYIHNSMSHVIEHLPDPVYVLQMCTNLLHEKGIVFISAPSRPVGWTASSSIEIWRNWELNQNPAHLQYFNRRSMERCARQSGLRLLNYEGNRDAFIAWLGHVPRFSPGRWV